MGSEMCIRDRSHARLPWDLNLAMAAADVAPQFGAELKVSLLEGDGRRLITNWVNLSRIPSNRSTVGYGPDIVSPQSTRQITLYA